MSLSLRLTPLPLASPSLHLTRARFIGQVCADGNQRNIPQRVPRNRSLIRCIESPSKRDKERNWHNQHRYDVKTIAIKHKITCGDSGRAEVHVTSRFTPY